MTTIDSAAFLAPQLSAGNLQGQNINSIVILEDALDTQRQIRDTLVEFGFDPVYVVENGEEVLRYAKEGLALNFILDVNMGPGPRRREGLNVSEKLKAFDDTLFVCLLSYYPGMVRTEAQNIGVDLILPKSKNTHYDVLIIIQKILLQNKQRIDDIWSNIIKLLNPLPNNPGTSAEDDPNYQTYLTLINKSNWLAEHRGEFVAIAAGEVIACNKDKHLLLSELQSYRQHKHIFITEVDENIIDIPSILP